MTETLLGNKLGAGYAKVDHTPGLARSLAIVVRSVVIALGGITSRLTLKDWHTVGLNHALC